MSFIFNLKIDNNSLFICNCNFNIFYFEALLYFMSNKKVKQIKTLSETNQVVNTKQIYLEKENHFKHIT